MLPEQIHSTAGEALARKQQAARTLIDEIVALYRANPLTVAVAAALEDAEAAALMEYSPRLAPVTRHVETAVANGRGGPCAGLAAAFGAVALDLWWRQNANYVAAPPNEDFLNNYGYVELVGPGSAIKSDAIRVGLLLLGSRVSYPAHRHPAEEIYHVISGNSRWWRQGEEWRHEAAGALIHHPPGVPHAMACNEEPLLALYVWMGDIGAAAQLC